MLVGIKTKLNTKLAIRQRADSFLPGVLKTGWPEILSQVQLIASNLSKHNLLKARMVLV